MIAKTNMGMRRVWRRPRIKPFFDEASRQEEQVQRAEELDDARQTLSRLQQQTRMIQAKLETSRDG